MKTTARNGESGYLTTYTIPNNVKSTKIYIVEFLFKISQWRSKNYLIVKTVPYTNTTICKAKRTTIYPAELFPCVKRMTTRTRIKKALMKAPARDGSAIGHPGSRYRVHLRHKRTIRQVDKEARPFVRVSDIVRLRQTYISGKKQLLSVYSSRHSSD